MSRHFEIDRICLCASSAAVGVDWSKFVEPHAAEQKTSPIDSFYHSHEGLNKLAGLVESQHVDSNVRNLLGGQLLLGYVSATELFLRQAIARSVDICPIVRAYNRNQTIPFGALDYYERQSLTAALTERVSFSEPGTIRNQLDQRLHVKINPKSSLARSIEDFERLCQLRHALIHSHGIINSSNAALLSGVARSAKATIDLQCLQWVASIVINLVRDANAEIVRTIVWRWVGEGLLCGDGRKDGPRLRRLVMALGSNTDLEAQRGVTSERELNAMVRRAISDVSM